MNRVAHGSVNFARRLHCDAKYRLHLNDVVRGDDGTNATL
jgi:hypothetical protein